MTAPAAGFVAVAATRDQKLRYASLFSAWADSAMLAIPVVVTALAFALARYRGEGVDSDIHSSLVWSAGFVLGNTSHVLLTFFLLATRRDMLHARPRQATTVTVGSTVVFALTALLMWLTRRDVSFRQLFVVSTAVFAVHHTVSQAKGFWALYSLRGAGAGIPAPSERERALQKNFVPLALLVVAIKWTLVGQASRALSAPYLNVNPGSPALLPFAFTWALLGAWLIYVALLLRALLSYERLNGAKLVYVGTQCAVVALEVLAPGWGITIGGGIHGLEYYLLTRRMLAPTPREQEKGSRLNAGLCVPAMIAAMSPILVVGALTNPWVPLWPFGKAAAAWANNLVMASVLAHYYADAFIYRLRTPSVRAVVLGRLGLG
jgi:hypothetical protein